MQHWWCLLTMVGLGAASVPQFSVCCGGWTACESRAQPRTEEKSHTQRGKGSHRGEKVHSHAQRRRKSRRKQGKRKSLRKPIFNLRALGKMNSLRPVVISCILLAFAHGNLIMFQIMVDRLQTSSVLHIQTCQFCVGNITIESFCYLQIDLTTETLPCF